MTLADSLYTYLSEYAGLVALVGTRVYPGELPDKPALPAVTFDETPGELHGRFGGNPTAATAEVDVYALASTAAGARAVAEQLYGALERFSGQMGGGVTVLTAAFANTPAVDTDRITNDDKVWIVSQTVRITYEI